MSASTTLQAAVTAAQNAAESLAASVEAGAFTARQEQEAATDEARSAIQAAMDVARAELGDAAFPLVTALRMLSARLLDLPSVAVDAPPLEVRVVETETNALTLALTWYGDASRADELVALNGLRWPLRIPAGMELVAYVR